MGVKHKYPERGRLKPLDPLSYAQQRWPNLEFYDCKLLAFVRQQCGKRGKRRGA